MNKRKVRLAAYWIMFRFIWYLLHPNESIIRVAIGLWRLNQKCCFDDFEVKSMLNKKFLTSSKTHCDSRYCPIWTQRVPNEALFNGVQMLLIFASKYFVYRELRAYEYLFITYGWIWSKVDVFFCYSVYIIAEIYILVLHLTDLGQSF